MAFKRYPLATCKTAKEYIEVALALEVLAYHNKNYLDSYFCDDCNLSEEIQLLLLEAIKKIDEGGSWQSKN